MAHCHSNNEHCQTASSAGLDVLDFADDLTGRAAFSWMRSPLAGEDGMENCSHQQIDDVADMPDKMKGTPNTCVSSDHGTSYREHGLHGDTPTTGLCVSDLAVVCLESINVTTTTTAGTIATHAPKSVVFGSVLSRLGLTSSMLSSLSSSPLRCDDEKSVGHSAFVVESDQEKDDGCDYLNDPSKPRPSTASTTVMGPGVIAACESAAATPQKNVTQKQLNEACSSDKDVKFAGTGKELYTAWKLLAPRRKVVQLRSMAHKYALEVVRQRYGGRTVASLSKQFPRGSWCALRGEIPPSPPTG
ncbi:metaciclina II [Trypanosoma rangeli]|uniref:Metaciclina II n=1 Tax=Trypanosoma rangeli TaxID=5698 RepID=A0A3R7M2Z6_TRYRA|nr:metaciclina II [Trypanosoma rangeli]RNE98443.1 metaciclina II [Trypanosoma rangeli]|eukprot:RNE98443.1 metaciclina II [Trypanosoma rangeli]